MVPPSDLMSLIEKIHDLDERIIQLENRIRADEKAIRANKEKAWFAYDRTINHEIRIEELEEAEENWE